MVKEDLKKWKEFQQRKNQSIIEKDGIKLICRLHSEIFNHKYEEPCTCNGNIYKSWIENINDHILKNYEKTNTK
jgi:DNA phosphorothioation-dependent restriction protein DptG|tara:strand:+ start:1641 stop:1862 length:222 start_codon:yes stop_codon:yes gene_type:complete